MIKRTLITAMLALMLFEGPGQAATRPPVTFKNGITYTFPAGTTLAPGAFLVIVESAAKFTAQFPAVPVAGVYAGKLDNGGDAPQVTIHGTSVTGA